MDEYEVERGRMVADQIRRRGVGDPNVLNVMRRVPRHEFIQGTGREKAYEDHPVPIGESQTISQPYMVAIMTELLGLTGTERVLEIGTGSGYQTAVLCECADRVFSIERFPRLSARARTTLTALGYDNVEFRVRDGTKGWPEEAPFDAILITAAAPAAPPSLLAQLADPGVLVIPVGPPGVQELVSIHRKDGRDEERIHFKCSFVPLVGLEGFPD
jgi:protein-L-isoaspartate(D-aspartate) O-methyltransferase